MKGMKIAGGALIAAGIGVAGYGLYKLYQAKTDAAALSGIGAFADGGVVDHNAKVAAKYWARMNELHREQQRLRAMSA